MENDVYDDPNGDAEYDMDLDEGSPGFHLKRAEEMLCERKLHATDSIGWWNAEQQRRLQDVYYWIQITNEAFSKPDSIVSSTMHMHAIPRLKAEMAQTHINIKDLTDAFAAVGDDPAFLRFVVPKGSRLGDATTQFLTDKDAADAAGPPVVPVPSTDDTMDGSTGKTGGAKLPGFIGPIQTNEASDSQDEEDEAALAA